MRTNLLIIIVLGLVIIVFSYIGETLTLSAMGEIALAAPTETLQERGYDLLKKIYGLWYYVRLAAISLGLLALWGLFLARKAQNPPPAPGN